MSPSSPHRSSFRAPVARALPAPASDAAHLLLPLCVAVLLALVLAWPHRLPAQQAATQTASATTTHVVQAGETLWSLATRYYGDGHKWRELARLNGLSSGDERGIAVGQVITVPVEPPNGRAPTRATPPVDTPPEAVTPAAAKPPAEKVAPPAELSAPPAADPAPAKAAEAPAGATAPTRDSMLLTESELAVWRDRQQRERSVRFGLADTRALLRARGEEAPTIFLGPAPVLRDTFAGTVALEGRTEFVAAPTMRIYEFASAPFPLAESAWRQAGRVEGRVAALGRADARGDQRIQWRDAAKVRFPAGSGEPAIGARFISLRAGADLGNGVRLAIPTGLFVVEAGPGDTRVAKLLRAFEIVEAGQPLIAAEEPPAPPVASDRVDSIATSVRWITDAPLLPSVQSFLLLDAGSEAGVAVGDRFALRSTTAGAPRVAVVRVVRVDATTSTAIVVHQDEPSIGAGLGAVRIGRAP